MGGSTESLDPAQLPPFLCVCGPTGTGKTELLHRLFAGRAEVISADSMQVYRDLHIGTAKPSAELLRALPHHLIGILDLDQVFDAGAFAHKAEVLLQEIASRAMIPIVSGGTGFYIRALLYGLPEAPPSDPEIRSSLERRLSEEGPELLRAELERIDPVSAQRIEAADYYRLLRALEVYLVSGRPRSSFATPKGLRPGLRVLPVFLHRPRAELYERINIRVERMFAQGLGRELRDLLAAGYDSGQPGLRSIGYKEFFEAVEAGSLSPQALESFDYDDCTAHPEVAELLRLIQRNTRRYAKRQMLYFRSLSEALHIHADDDAALKSVTERFFGSVKCFVS